MKKLMFIFLLFLCSCSSNTSLTPTNSTIVQNITNDPNIRYYQAIWNACTYAADIAKNSDPIKFCIPSLQEAVDEDWRDQTTWPPMPNIDFGYGLQKYSKNDPKFEYARGIYNVCIFTNVKDQGTDKVADFCLITAVQQSLDEDWYNKTNWYKMPNIEFNPNKPSGY